MKRTLLVFIIAALGSHSMADTYDPNTNQLTISSIELDGVIYSNVVVTVGTVVTVGSEFTLSPTQPKFVGAPQFTAGSSPKIQIKFDRDMAVDHSEIGDFKTKTAYWEADKRTFAIEFESFVSGGNIIFPNTGFKSVGGESPGNSVTYTFPRKWATVGTPTPTRLTYDSSATTQGSPATSCTFSLPIPVTGTIPVTFTGWRAVWSSGHSESGTTNVSVDPTAFTSLQWLGSRVPFFNIPRVEQFTVSYTVDYSIPATGQTGSVNTVLNCGP